MSNYNSFVRLHQADQPLVLGNAWDVNSARVMAKSGYNALGTSSAAVAHTLGYQDGEQVSFEELLFIVERIAANVDLPLTVDIEGGFGRDPDQIVKNIEKLHRLGIIGVNLEDSVVTGERNILPTDEFAQVVKTISSQLKSKGIEVFLNIRTDTFLLPVPTPLEETLARLSVYEESGADGIFVPCMVKEEDINRLTNATKLPINVMCMPGLPSFDKLQALGVRRISMGNALHLQVTRSMKSFCQAILEDRSFHSLFPAS